MIDSLLQQLQYQVPQIDLDMILVVIWAYRFPFLALFRRPW